MLGIPVKIERNGHDETVYLSTRRSGEIGGALRQAKKDYQAAAARAATLITRVGLITAKVDTLPDKPGFVEDLEKLLAEVDKLISDVILAQQAAQDAAVALITLALRDNHGVETEAILDCFTDSQVEKLVKVLTTGETPADFFPSRATPPSGSGSGPAAGGPGASSSKGGSPAPMSKPAG